MSGSYHRLTAKTSRLHTSNLLLLFVKVKVGAVKKLLERIPSIFPRYCAPGSVLWSTCRKPHWQGTDHMNVWPWLPACVISSVACASYRQDRQERRDYFNWTLPKFTRGKMTNSRGWYYTTTQLDLSHLGLKIRSNSPYRYNDSGKSQCGSTVSVIRSWRSRTFLQVVAKELSSSGTSKNTVGTFVLTEWQSHGPVSHSLGTYIQKEWASSTYVTANTVTLQAKTFS
jgi:hypothetical protein